MFFNAIVALVALSAGSIATVAGFGIGSLVTPLVAVQTGTSVAVAVVSIAHFCGTLLRFFFWRKHINKKVLLSFGITSAIGGLIGALLHNILYNSMLTTIFACLLIFAGIMGLTGLAEKMRFSGLIAWIAGGLSGLFGGLVGNQGGIRSAALLGFKVERKEFVATATGIALAVDVARMPVYLAVQGTQILAVWPLVMIATVGVLLGTMVGGSILKRIPEKVFKKIVAAIILVIGFFVLIHG